MTFESERVTCVADVYRPAGRSAPGPAIVVAHGYSSVREMSAEVGNYLAAQGYVAMAIDYRSFGASEGTPRAQLFPLREVEDVRSAITYLEARDDVDAGAIGLWGTSFGGGVVLYAAAMDRRVRAVMSQVPIVDGRRWQQWQRTGVGYEELLAALEEDRRARAKGAPGRRIPTVGHQGSAEIVGHAVDSEIVDAMTAYQAMLPTWSPDIALESLEKIIEFSPMSVIDRIAPRPLLMVGVSGYDIAHNPADIVEAFDRAREPKQMVVLPYGQFGLYSGEGLQHALGIHAAFFRTHMPPAA